MGMGSLTVRNVAHQKHLSNYYLRNTAGMRLIFSALFILVMAVIGLALGYEAALRLALLILGIRLLFDALSASYTALFQAHELMTYQGIVTFLSALLKTICIVLVVYFGGRITEVCWVWVGVGALSCLALWSIGRRQGWRIHWAQFRWGEAWDIVIRSIPFAAFGTFQILYYRVDAIILKSFAGNEAVALYDVAGKFLFVVFMIADHFSVATLPAFSAAQSNPRDLGRIAVRALKALTLMGLPIVVGGFLLAGPLMTFLFGVKYSAAGPAFAILSFSILFHFVMKPSINLLAIKAPLKLTLFFLGLLLVNVIANFYAIPRWGLMGAAAVSTLCEIPAFAVIFWIARDYFGSFGRGFYRGIAAAIAAAAVMGVAIYFNPRLYWLALGPVVYGGCLWAFRALEPEDWDSLKAIVGKRSGRVSKA
jgi:O-antigen/teichoic acid export membrane protein